MMNVLTTHFCTQDVGKAGFLWPVIFSIFDFQYRAVSDLRLTNLNAKTTYLGNKVFGCSSEYMCLKQPLYQADRVLCNKPPTQMDCTGIPANGAPFAMSPGGCTCDRRKAVSNGSTSFFATGIDGSESSAMTTARGWLEAQQRVQVSSLMHNFVRSAWALNPSWVQVRFDQSAWRDCMLEATGRAEPSDQKIHSKHLVIEMIS
jgi:hypothetical protein